MKRLVVAFGLLFATFVLPAAAQAPRELVARAIAAMGGEPALTAASVITADFNTATFALGQEETPASPARATFASGQTVTDLRAMRRVLTQEVRPLTGGVQRQRRVTAGGIGLLETDGRQAADAPATVGTTERGMRLSPERLLASALAGGTSALPARTLREESGAGVSYAAGPDTLNLFFDPRTGLLLMTEHVMDDPILGDRRTATWYTRWQDAGGIKLPRQIDVEYNGRIQSHTVITAARVGPADAAAFTIPDSISSRAQRAIAAAPAQVPTVASIAPGLWWVAGGTHHSMVVEQPSQLIVVEGPFSTQRTAAVLDTLKARFPTKPVSLVVNTHHHWDHASGLRGYLAAGVPVLTHARNGGYVRGIASAAKTVAPDALTRGGRVPEVRTMTDSLTIGEGSGRIVLYHAPTSHVEGMLIAYVPSAKTVFNSDLFGPGQAPNAVFARELVAAVRARGIAVDKVVGGHGTAPVAWSEVEKVAQ